MKGRIGKMILLAIRQMQDPYYQGFAAQMAFFFLLSIVPILVVLSQILGLFDITLDFLREFISEYVQLEVANTLMDFLGSPSAGATNVIFILIALWAGSRAQFAMGRLTNYTMTNGRTTGTFFKERARSLVTIIITLFTITFSLIVLVYGRTILNIVLGNTISGEELENVWLTVRWPIAGALYFLMIAYNYYILPSKRIPFREVVPGAIFASLGLLLVTLLYSKYMTYVSNYNILYGSLATIVALMFWFYFMAWVMWLGVLFNKCWMDSEKPDEEL